MKNEKTEAIIKEQKKKALPTIDIKGKPYVLTQDRLLYFHDNFPNGSIVTDIVSDTNESVVMITKVTPDVLFPARVFTGVAQESRGSTFINKTSHYENCETSSRARALAGLGIGVEESCASADEVANAIIQQTEDKIISGVKKCVLDLMTLFQKSEKWLAKAIELGIAKPDIMNVSLGYILNSKTIDEAEDRGRKTHFRFTDLFDKLNNKLSEENQKAK